MLAEKVHKQSKFSANPSEVCPSLAVSNWSSCLLGSSAKGTFFLMTPKLMIPIMKDHDNEEIGSKISGAQTALSYISKAQHHIVFKNYMEVVNVEDGLEAAAGA